MSDGTLTTADIAIVGAGIVGLTTAWELSQRGYRVAVLEQRFVTFGSSGRNPGGIWLQPRKAGAELSLARAGQAKYDSYADLLGNVFSHRKDGSLFFFEDEKQLPVVEEYIQERRESGLNVSLLERSEAQELTEFLPETALGAVYCADDAQIDTLQFTSALADLCRKNGVQIFENTAALGTSRRGAQVIGLHTVRGTVEAPGIIWATGAWAKNLTTEGLYLPLETYRLGQVMTQPIASRRSSVMMRGPRGTHNFGSLRALPAYQSALFDHAESLDMEYDDTIIQNRNGSLYFGHSVDGAGSLNPHITLRATMAMLDTVEDRYPQLADFGVTGLWAGLHSETTDGLPLVGSTDGVYLNVGHTWGVASAPICGQILAEIISGDNNSWEPILAPERSTEAN